ncbi:MAG: 2,4'-dihydroxyacetophenone dioxygenase family protein [Rhizobiaceae bacterium]|nr:2,4'-dihydroxyacetophenone dioxygenase family protein [Rhizobiaceae bacterium]
MTVTPRNPYALKEVFLADALADDERLWVKSADDVAFRPLFLSASQGYWMTIARIRRSGVVSRHSHPQPVHGYTIKGRWRYLEHDWVAEAGSYIFEPPGDTHTLVVDAEGGEMMTLFQVHGSMIYVDAAGAVTGYDDVFTRIEQCRRHFEAVGLGASYVERFIR